MCAKRTLLRPGGLALVRCDGGGSYGFGHVKRMIALARALRDREGLGAVFAVNGSADALPPIRQAGFAAKLIDGRTANFFRWQRIPILSSSIAAKVLRARSSNVCRCRSRPWSTMPPTGGLAAISLITTRCRRPPRCNGPARAASRASVGSGRCSAKQMPERPRSHSPCPTLLVTMGGSDPFGLTERCALALRQLDPVFRARFVIGPGFKDKNRLARSIVSLAPNFETVEGADGLRLNFAACDVALAAFG